jgi:predicted O-methyltransferase YrrM
VAVRGQLRWSDDTQFTVDGTEFRYAYGLKSTVSSFSILKPRPLVEDYVRLLERVERPRILEIGIAAGGSAALMSLLASPAKLVAVDIEGPVQGLEAFIDEHDLRSRVHTYYGVDQSDRSELGRIVEAEFGDEPIDIVIDDASHLLQPTRASFEVVFPFVRPGGWYVIEDWNWQGRVSTTTRPIAEQQAQWTNLLADAITERPGLAEEFERKARAAFDDPTAANHESVRRRFEQAVAGQDIDGTTREELFAAFPSLERFYDQEPLVTLIFELVLARAAGLGGETTAIDAVDLGPWWATVRRGSQALTPGAFRLRDLYADVHDLLAGQPVGDLAPER